MSPPPPGDKQFVLIWHPARCLLYPEEAGLSGSFTRSCTKMDQSEHCSQRLLCRQGGAFLHNESYVDNVKGRRRAWRRQRHRQPDAHEDQPLIRRSGSVYVNGKPIVRTADQVWMNWKKP